MGDFFGGGGPSDGDIERAEKKAYEEERERLRKAEEAARRRESRETMQGDGFAVATNIVLGSDAERIEGGADRVKAGQVNNTVWQRAIRENPEIWGDLLFPTTAADSGNTGGGNTGGSTPGFTDPGGPTRPTTPEDVQDIVNDPFEDFNVWDGIFGSPYRGGGF